jgi:hypothetical protein
MSTARLSSEQIRALARMARGGVFVDRDGRGVLHGHPVIDRGTVDALSDARLIAVDPTAGATRLTGAGRARLAVVRHG